MAEGSSTRTTTGKPAGVRMSPNLGGQPHRSTWWTSSGRSLWAGRYSRSICGRWVNQSGAIHDPVVTPVRSGSEAVTAHGHGVADTINTRSPDSPSPYAWTKGLL